MNDVREKWNRRYRERERQPPVPPAFVTTVAPRLKPGRLLDVGAGDGAASLYLAARGFAVTAVDIAGEGLARLAEFAAQQELEVETDVRDLSVAGCLDGLGAFDSILICRYKPEPGLWSELATHLVPGGTLAIGTFNLQQHRATGFSARFCLAPDELAGIDPALELLEYRSTERDGDFFDEYLFRRRPIGVDVPQVGPRPDDTSNKHPA